MLHNHTLPPRQSQLLQLIARVLKEGRAPTFAELIEAMGLARESSLANLLAPLERKGLIAIQRGGRGVPRAIALTAEGWAAARAGIPVLGRIPAGPMLLAENEVSEWLEPGTVLNTQPGDFFLPVFGDSMIGDGILDGDRVLIRPNVVIGNGEIAAVAEEDAGSGEYLATLKRVYYMPNEPMVRLKASNPKYEDIVLPAQRVRIAGAYRGLFRRFL